MKGGTALKKAHLASYRFSEDLDYSSRAGQRTRRRAGAYRCSGGRDRTPVARAWGLPGHLGATGAAAATSRWTGCVLVRVQFPGQRRPLCRLKVEITHDELVLWPEVSRPLQHNYAEPLEAELDCYALEEIAGRKAAGAVAERPTASRARLGRQPGWPRLLRSVALVERGAAGSLAVSTSSRTQMRTSWGRFRVSSRFHECRAGRDSPARVVPPTGPICTGLPGG